MKGAQKSAHVKICHLTTVHPRFDNRIFHKECKSLSSNGYKVILIVADGLGNETNSEVKIIDIGTSKNRCSRVFILNFKVFNIALKQKAKIYHFHDPEFIFYGILLRLLNKKVIFDIHENVALSIKTKFWLPKFLRIIIAFIYRSIELVAIKFFDSLILAEDSYLNYYPTKKSIVIHNFPEIKNVETLRKSISQKENINFLYLGLINQYRGICESIDIIYCLYKKGINCRFDVLGLFESNELEKDIKQKVKKLKLERIIKFHGQLSQDQVQLFLQKAHFGFSLLHPIPNYKESLPTKIFEYMQFGIPVIASDIELYYAYVKNIQTGICVPLNDIDFIVHEIIKISNDNDLYEIMAENGRNTIIREFNWEVEKKRLIQAYNDLLNE